MIAYEPSWICPVTAATFSNGVLLVDNGRIVDVVVSAAVSPEYCERVRFPGCAIVPGFVNAHAHLELTSLRGFLENVDFIGWIRKLIETKYGKMLPEELQASARAGAEEMVRAGVTCIGEVMDIGTSWGAMREFGLQGVAYQEVFGPGEQQADEALAGLKNKIEGFRAEQSETCRLGVSPHAPYTVSPKLFRLVAEYAAAERLPVTIHIAESVEEDDYVRNGKGPFAERNRERGFAVDAMGCGGIAFLNRFGILGPHTLLIHAVRTDPADLEIVAHTGSPVVHCPKSNAKLAHGIAPVAEMQRHGVTLGLGTDSVASNNVVDMFEEMRMAIFMQRAATGRVDALNAHSAFRMATLGGAECLGLGAYLGSLEKGKRADFAVIDLRDPAVRPVFDPVETMVYSACRSDIAATYIGGVCRFGSNHFQ